MQKRKDKINRKKYHFILVIAAIAIVVLLDAGMILMPDHTSSDMENRTLQTFPKLTFSTLVSGKFESEFETLLEGYKGIAKLTEGTDITLNAMIVPTAVNIYSKKLPFGAVKGDQKAFLTQLQSDLAASGINWIDLSEPFAACDKATQLYYRTDHHWTSDAALLAYQTYNKTLGLIPKKYFPILSKVLCPLPAACVHQKRMKFMRIFRIRPQITLSA